MYYFAYGMNTDPTAMSERLAKSNRTPHALGAAVLEDWRFRFAYYADVQPSAGSKVEGVLWSISKEHLKALDAREGYPYYYNRKIVKVQSNGRTFSAWVYFMQDGEPTAPPSQSYMDMLIRGYSTYGADLSQVYQAHSESHQVDKERLLEESLQAARAGRAYERMCYEEVVESSPVDGTADSYTRGVHTYTEAEWQDLLAEDERDAYMAFNFGKYYR